MIRWTILGALCRAVQRVSSRVVDGGHICHPLLYMLLNGRIAIHTMHRPCRITIPCVCIISCRHCTKYTSTTMTGKDRGYFPSTIWSAAWRYASMTNHVIYPNVDVEVRYIRRSLAMGMIMLKTHELAIGTAMLTVVPLCLRSRSTLYTKTAKVSVGRWPST
jgi:hypothetical protein